MPRAGSPAARPFRSIIDEVLDLNAHFPIVFNQGGLFFIKLLMPRAADNQITLPLSTKAKVTNGQSEHFSLE